MRERCSKPAKDNYEYYGGRGIRVCERWSDFSNFLADMGERPIGTTLDRINHDGDYAPSNCRWATKVEQANNTRVNRVLTIDGERMTMAEASRRYGVKMGTIWLRLEKGWSDDHAAKTRPWGLRRTMESTRRAEGKAYG